MGFLPSGSYRIRNILESNRQPQPGSTRTLFQQGELDDRSGRGACPASRSDRNAPPCSTRETWFAGHFPDLPEGGVEGGGHGIGSGGAEAGTEVFPIAIASPEADEDGVVG